MCGKCFSTKQIDEHLHSILMYLVLMSMRIFEAKTIGLQSWIRAAPSPYSLTPVCITMGLV